MMITTDVNYIYFKRVPREQEQYSWYPTRGMRSETANDIELTRLKEGSGAMFSVFFYFLDHGLLKLGVTTRVDRHITYDVTWYVVYRRAAYSSQAQNDGSTEQYW